MIPTDHPNRREFLGASIVAVSGLTGMPLYAQQRQGRPQGAPPPPAPIEFLGWDYEKFGFSLSPGEEPALLFRNNQAESAQIPVTWRLTTYAGAPLTQGNTELRLNPGATGQVPVTIPPDLADGAYFVRYRLDDSTQGREKLFHFDFRRPVPDATLNLNIVALIENMDDKAWARMMLGPMARYATIWCDWPLKSNMHVDAVLVIAEAMKVDDPRLVRLREYVQQGGSMLCFGKPGVAFIDLLPIHPVEEPWYLDTPQRLQTMPGGPWRDFLPEKGLSHYGVRIREKAGSTVLAQWEDGTPTVVSGQYGKGRVVYVGAGSGQVWQQRDSLNGADEMALRLLYWMTGGDSAVNAMLNRAELLDQESRQTDAAVCGGIFKNLQQPPPQDYYVVSRNNVSRFGWLIGEGGLVDNLEQDGTVTPLSWRSFVMRSGIPFTTDHQLSWAVSVGNTQTPQAIGVSQNWLSKTITWQYENGVAIRSTISVGSPAILWEGDASDLRLTCRNVTHFAFATKTGIRVVTRGGTIDPLQMTENWILTITANAEVRDMPQLFVLTRKPNGIRLQDGIQLFYGAGGVGALFTTRLMGIRRMTPGETGRWVTAIPDFAVSAARRWSRILLSYPVDCDEVGWADGDTICLADRFHYRTFRSDWGTDPLMLSPLPPVFHLAQQAGAPVQLPADMVDLECPTKYGPLKSVEGETTLVRIPLPPRDHRALIPTEGRMELQGIIDRLTDGLGMERKEYVDRNVRNEGSGDLHADLAMYDLSRRLPYNEAPSIDVYKWWYCFNALMARPVYSPSVQKQVDQHNRIRYQETLNFYSHKCFVQQKREPWTCNEYMISFVWPTQTQFGFRNFNDGNEASGVNVYCYTSYARYYGDWATLRANWNLCRRLHEFLPRVSDWACMSSGSNEYFETVGLDMLNSEPHGSLTYAYAATHAGTPRDVIMGLVLGARSLVPCVARLGLQEYVRSISAEDDPWREPQGFYWFHEDGLQMSPVKMGSIGMHDTSKGTFHELSLAYKIWTPDRMREEEQALESRSTGSSFGGASIPNLTQRLFLGWEISALREQARTGMEQRMAQTVNWQTTKDMYDLALLCTGDIPLFLSDWTPAEYVSGLYMPERRELNLVFRSHEGESFRVKIYSQRRPVEVSVDGTPLAQGSGGWLYDSDTGWLVISMNNSDEKHLRIRLGEPVAPLHPYFT